MMRLSDLATATMQGSVVAPIRGSVVQIVFGVMLCLALMVCSRCRYVFGSWKAQDVMCLFAYGTGGHNRGVDRGRLPLLLGRTGICKAGSMCLG
jgi:hypothetical protein